jgi:hypothetical protein
VLAIQDAIGTCGGTATGEGNLGPIPLVKGELDPNSDFKRNMGVNNVPHTFLLDKEGNIVYTHNNYVPGDEEKLFEEIKKLSNK